MLKTRIIPCLDVIENKVVKGVNFKNIKVMGNAVDMANYYSSAGADELCMLDINASYQKRKTFIKTVESIAKVINIPFTVGGGVSALQDITDLLNAGADKVSINSAAVKNPLLVHKAARKHGSQCIVVAIDGKRHGRQMRVFVKGGRELTSKELVSWSKKVQDLGAGEILLTSMDTDGVQNGFDGEMLKKVTKNVNIPVIASGGVGELNHFYLGYLTKATGLLAASVFHSGKYKIEKVKQYLNAKGVPVRL
ncbi:imidazole glycerol phosphate synthase subunit HisF [bacterium]|nr:imidazole glycerol phosphate synthase subunit HisF [bacterium]